jgi:hypothetical protein
VVTIPFASFVMMGQSPARARHLPATAIVPPASSLQNVRSASEYVGCT